MTNRSRKDKGQVRKVTPEELLEALNAAKPHFHNQRTNKRALYRFCIEKGLLQTGRIAQTTFYRFINLAHCFCCHKNLNNIDLLLTLDYDFHDAVSLLQRWLRQYQTHRARKNTSFIPK